VIRYGKSRRGLITDRDRSALEWLVRNSATTIGLAAKYRYGSAAMASRRLRILCEWGLVRKVNVGRRLAVYIATAKGAEFAGLGINPPRSGLLTEIEHSLTVCDILEELASRWSAKGILTERELRVDALRRQRSGETVSGRMPDGLVVMPDGGRIAIEYERNAKRSVHLSGILRSLLPRLGTGNEWEGVMFVVPTPAAATRYLKVVASLAAEDVVWVLPIQQVLP
jgi:hypothetical protein